MFKVNNKDTRMIPMASFWLLFVNLEHVISTHFPISTTPKNTAPNTHHQLALIIHLCSQQRDIRFQKS